MTFDELAASLRQIGGQRDKGKHPPNFHFRSKPFLHFRNGPGRTYADVRFGGDFEPVTGSTPKQREVLLGQAPSRRSWSMAWRAAASAAWWRRVLACARNSDPSHLHGPGL
jgi:hypothetical protein